MGCGPESVSPVETTWKLSFKTLVEKTIEATKNKLVGAGFDLGSETAILSKHLPESARGLQNQNFQKNFYLQANDSVIN